MDIPVPVGLTFCGIAIFITWKIYAKKVARINSMPSIPQKLPANGFEVPVIASFTGLENGPRQKAESHNSINPSLTLFEDHLKYRVLLRQKLLYRDIEKIDIQDTIGTRNLHVYPTNDQSTFTANLLNRKNLLQVLVFLKRKGIRLSSCAEKFLKQSPS